jgi:hypothetical protein
MSDHDGLESVITIGWNAQSGAHGVRFRPKDAVLQLLDSI